MYGKQLYKYYYDNINYFNFNSFFIYDDSFDTIYRENTEIEDIIKKLSHLQKDLF